MKKRPFELILCRNPKDFDYGVKYFYENFCKPLTTDIIRMMNVGINLNFEKIKNLHLVIDEVLVSVSKTLANNTKIKEYLNVAKVVRDKDIELKASINLREYTYYLKPYNSTSIIHRTYLLNIRAKELAVPTKAKWTVRDTKLLTREMNVTHLQDYQKRAMEVLAQEKYRIYMKASKRRVETKIEKENKVKFNPASTKDKEGLFKMLKIQSSAKSPITGKDSWGRTSFEEQLLITRDQDVKEILKAFIDFSFSAIIKNNFLSAFSKFTINDVLYGNLRNFGAKTYRLTSNSPSLLNMPSSASRFAKPLKECLVAPDGYYVFSIDYSSLENKVSANLTKDKNRIITETDKDIDGHLFHATIYFKKEFEEILGKGLSHRELTIKAKQEMDKGNKRIDELRSTSKSVSFGCNYGAHPPKIASSIKCSLEEAKKIFNAYHNDMYPKITEFREQYVAKTVAKQGYIHMGLGCRLYSNNPKKDIRTINNSLFQFWSILTLISINELHYRIDKESLECDIKPNNSIYDSIYGIVKKDVNTIKWLNDNIVEIMEKDFLHNQIVKNKASLFIGTDWSNGREINKEASIEEIQTILKKEF